MGRLDALPSSDEAQLAASSSMVSASGVKSACPVRLPAAGLDRFRTSAASAPASTPAPVEAALDPDVLEIHDAEEDVLYPDAVVTHVRRDGVGPVQGLLTRVTQVVEHQ